MTDLLVVAAISAVVSGVFTGAARPLLRRFGVVDIANERSAHTGVAIRGAGVGAALAVLIVGGVVVATYPDSADRLVVIVAASVAVAALGFLDDIAGLAVRVRLATQVALALLVAFASATTGLVPWWLVPIGVVFFVGAVNVVNFMDGIDGVSGSYGVASGIAFVAVGTVGSAPWLALAGALTAGVFMGFLPWNIAKRGTFLGDAGSYLLGGLLGTAAFCAIGDGVPVTAIAGIAVVYLADTVYTLVVRIRAGRRWSESHREHLYQRLGFEQLGHARAAALVISATSISGVAGILTLPAIGLPPVVAAVVFAAVAAGYLLTCRLLLRRQQAEAVGNAGETP